MTAQNIPYKIYLHENEMPTAWYNLRADMKNNPAPLLNPGTKQQGLKGVTTETGAGQWGTALSMACPYF